MKIIATSLPGVLVLEPRVFTDARGFFVETYNVRSLGDSEIPESFPQDNHSRSRRRVLRGLHYQLSVPQGKLVHVARGRIFDVAVDIRVGSPTFGKWYGTELSDENLRSLWIPPGFAHGFYALSDLADVIYKCTALYDAGDDRGVNWNDPRIGIGWPESNPVVSEKDAALPFLDDVGSDLPRYKE